MTATDTAREPAPGPRRGETPSSPFVALLWLRAKLLQRQLTASRARLVFGITLGMALALPSLGSAVLLALALRDAEPETRAAAVHLVFAAAWCAWALAPLAGFRENEFFDPGKLALLPVRRETVFFAGMAGSLLNRSVLFFGPSYFVAAAALPRTALESAVALLVALVLLFQAIAAGQCLTLALLHTLRSRKFRDLAAALSPLVAVGVYAAWRSLAGAGEQSIATLLEAGRSPFLLLLPSGWASHALPGGALPLAARAGLALATLVTLYLLVRLGAALERRAFFSEVDLGGGGGAKAKAGEGAPRRKLLARLLEATLAPETAAVASKDLTIFRREPAMKAQIVSLAGFLLLPAFFAVARPGESRGLAAMQDPLPFFSLMLALVASGFLTNLFGLEGPGVSQLFVHPAPRSRVLLGKAIAALVLFVPVNLVLLAAGTALSALIRGTPFAAVLPSLGRHALFHAIFLVVIAAVGLFASIVAPVRAMPRGKRVTAQQAPEKRGCLTAVVRLSILLVSGLAAAPLAALVFLPLFLEVPAAAAVVLRVAAAAIAGVGLFVAARVAGDLLAPREAKIAALLTHAPE